MRLTFTFCWVLLLRAGFGQGVGIGNALPDRSAVLDITSGTKGILIPRMDDSTATSAWRLSGNEGINAGQFIGTLDSTPLVFRVGNVFSGILDSVNTNTALGLGAIAVNKSSGNSAIGAGALGSNINGKDNIALGLVALGSNTSGTDNEAVGFGSLYHDHFYSFCNAMVYGFVLSDFFSTSVCRSSGVLDEQVLGTYILCFDLCRTGSLVYEPHHLRHYASYAHTYADTEHDPRSPSRCKNMVALMWRSHMIYQAINDKAIIVDRNSPRSFLNGRASSFGLIQSCPVRFGWLHMFFSS